MNLYIETLTEYLIREWDAIHAASTGTQEARFVIESLSASNTFALLQALEQHRLKLARTQKIRHHFKVAYGLWKAWQDEGLSREHLIAQMRALGGVDSEGNLRWIDEDDRLTYFRNDKKGADDDHFIAVLIGIGHTSDQGGLTDFHLVDEERVWSELGASFYSWLKKLCERVGLTDYNDDDLERFDTALHELFSIKPRRLLRLAEYLENQFMIINSYESSADLLVHFYKTLPFWDLPPLLYTPEQVRKVKETKSILKDANTFISHQKLKSKSEQKKVLDKINKALANQSLETPNTVGSGKPYDDSASYYQTLLAFIEKGDSQAREKLLYTDQLALLRLIKTRETGKKQVREKVNSVRGSSIEAMLLAIWDAILSVSQAMLEDDLDWIESIIKIEVIAKRFSHDLETDTDNNLGGTDLARDVLNACIGGLDQFLQNLNLRLPQDEAEAYQPIKQWSREIELAVNFELEPASYKVSRKRPHLAFDIIVHTPDPELSYTHNFEWRFEATHAERVRYQCAKAILEKWRLDTTSTTFLPGFTLDNTVMTALYYAADEEEANRLLNNALGNLKVENLMEGLQYNQPTYLNPELATKVQSLAECYRLWLKKFTERGYYTANLAYYAPLEEAYKALATAVLDKSLNGSAELLRRFYKAFLLLNTQAKPNDAYLASAIIIGISPAIIELSSARETFLRDHFHEVLAQYVQERDIKGKKAHHTLERLLNLVLLQRPLAGLVVDDTVTAKTKGFNLFHYLGKPPASEKSLAVQTLLREDDELEEEQAEIKHSSEDSRIIAKVLSTYQSLYPFAADGLRVLAVYVENVPLTLSGIDLFLTQYLSLKEQKTNQQPAFFCDLMVYSTSSSPIAIEKKLALWRDDIVERFREKGRPLNLSVAHKFAPKRDHIIGLLRKEQRLYDVAFLFRFLGEEMKGRIEAAESFESHFDGSSKFPISEYPRPIDAGDPFIRKSLLSNRRLRIQTLHVDLSARLRNPQADIKEHLLFGEINYAPWQDVIEGLHAKSNWVACVDSFIDKRLIGKYEDNSSRKIVGFTSGLGAYGELNLSISTEQDTLDDLSGLVRQDLSDLLPNYPKVSDTLAKHIVDEAEEVIGLASLRAVLGNGEKIREVIGFAAIQRLLAKPAEATMTQLLPLDALQHWLSESESNNSSNSRADLLQLSIVMRPATRPLIIASVIECKLALQSSTLLEKAIDQVQDTLAHLTQLFAPHRLDIRRAQFDRRYWWAQLQRALTSRTILALSETEKTQLNSALEKVAEGDYNICWKGAIFTFWTDIAQQNPLLRLYPLAKGTLNLPFNEPENFHLHHWTLGYDGLISLFEAQQSPVKLDELGITVQPCDKKQNYQNTTTPDTPISPTVDDLVTVSPLKTEPNVISTTPEFTPEDPATIVEPESVVTPPQPKPDPIILPPNSKSSVPQQLLIGKKQNGELVYWHYGHPQLSNRHLLILGNSGYGKTYTIQCLLAEMAHQGLHSFIIDYTDGFLPTQLEDTFKISTLTKNHFVLQKGLPLNPLRRQLKVVDPSIDPFEEGAFEVAIRVTNLFNSVFTMGDQQTAVLTKTIIKGLEESDNFSLDDLLPLLEAEGQTGITLANKLTPFIRCKAFSQEGRTPWEDMLNATTHKTDILQLTGRARDIQRIITEFILWDLYDYAGSNGHKNAPIPIVLDEIQNLNHNSDSPIDKMLREGRKFGLSLILATQTISNDNYGREGRDRLFQTGHKLFFRPSETEVSSYADLLAKATRDLSKNDWETRLSRLTKGQCYSLGPTLLSNGELRMKAELVQITSLEERNLLGGL